MMDESSTSLVIHHNDTDISITAINTATSGTIVVFRLITPHIVLWYFRLIVFGILGQVMAVMGSVTNIINIVIFLKLGVRNDAMNISLLGLSISDFGSCFTLIFLNLCLTPGFTENEKLPFTPIGTHYVFSSWPHLLLVKLTVCITGFITIERCLCVTFPLKIKQLITPQRVAIIIISLYLLHVCVVIPICHIYRMEFVFFPERNKSVYTLVVHEDRPKLEPPLIATFGVAMPFVVFFSTIVATIILVHNLKKNAKWRASITATTTGTSETTSDSVKTQTSSSSRDKRVAKMVAVISILYIACYLPVAISSVAMLTVPELKKGGAFHNTLYVIFSINYLFESTNASLNVFIYYAMSANYKNTLQNVFCSKSIKDER